MTDIRSQLSKKSIVVPAFEMPERPAVEPTDKPTSPTYGVNLGDRYHSDDNRIVLLTYENGTTFILNFNSFAVTTTLGDIVYTAPAYGYVVVK